MDFGSLLLGFALLLLVGFVVARPLLEPHPAPEKGISPADRLAAQRDSLLTALRDLDFDHATGKIGDDDYAPQRAQLVAQGVVVLKQLDALRPAMPQPAPNAADAVERAVAARRRPASDERRSLAEEGARPAPRTAQSADDRIEADVAARRKPASAPRPAPALGGTTCANCGTRARPDDRFCPTCGAALAGACPVCGRPVQPGDRFCAACGANLQPAQTPG
jgi:double zinc ribbon protein